MSSGMLTEIIPQDKHVTAAIKDMTARDEPPSKIISRAARKMWWIARRSDWGENNRAYSAQVSGLKAVVDTMLSLVKMDEDTSSYESMSTADMLEACKRAGLDPSKYGLKIKMEATVGPQTKARPDDVITVEGGAAPVRPARSFRKQPGGVPPVGGDDPGVPWGQQLPGAGNDPDGCVDGEEVPGVRNHESVSRSGMAEPFDFSGSPGT